MTSSTFQGPGGWNDADFIYTGGEGCSDDRPLEHCPGQTDTEYITEFIMWCMMGSPLIVATDIRNMTDIMKKVIKSIYTNNNSWEINFDKELNSEVWRSIFTTTNKKSSQNFLHTIHVCI